LGVSLTLSLVVLSIMGKRRRGRKNWALNWKSKGENQESSSEGLVQLDASKEEAAFKNVAKQEEEENLGNNSEKAQEEEADKKSSSTLQLNERMPNNEDEHEPNHRELALIEALKASERSLQCERRKMEETQTENEGLEAKLKLCRFDLAREKSASDLLRRELKSQAETWSAKMERMRLEGVQREEETRIAKEACASNGERVLKLESQLAEREECARLLASQLTEASLTIDRQRAESEYALKSASSALDAAASRAERAESRAAEALRKEERTRREAKRWRRTAREAEKEAEAANEEVRRMRGEGNGRRVDRMVRILKHVEEID